MRALKSEYTIFFFAFSLVPQAQRDSHWAAAVDDVKRTSTIEINAVKQQRRA